jgi:hypothetical protein
MSAKGDELKIQAAPVMSDMQRWVLDNMLGGMANMMQGFTLGTPYGGANASSYNPLKFDFTKYVPGFTNPYSPGEKKTVDKNNPPKKKTDYSPAAAPESPPSPFNPIKLTSTNPASYVLNNIPANQMPPSNDELLTKQMISPFVLPYLYGMTGNYPRQY